MSGQTGDQQDRTEAPTARRLQKAQEEGEVPVSREAVQLASLLTASLTFLVLKVRLGSYLVHSLSLLIERLDAHPIEPPALIKAAMTTCAVAAAPVMIAGTAGSVAATFAQSRFALRSRALHIDIRRLSPAKGLARLTGSDGLVETGVSLAKLLIVASAVGLVLRHELRRLETLPTSSLGLLPEVLVSVATRATSTMILALVVIAGADIFWHRRQHQRRLRMSRSEIKGETKETEGDPATKMRLRRIRMRRARQRMLAAVPTATVVVTNPTHYAIALSYEKNTATVPKLVAKGVDSLAVRIREMAREHGVPVVANPPLARALHELQVGSFIPPELYKVVAELIAYIWLIRRPLVS